MNVVEVHHVADGPADGPVVLLAHSVGTSLALWDAQVAPLADAGRVVRYDHRGHGASPAPPGPYTIADLGADALALLDRLGVERASFVGISLGGMVALWLGAYAPERIDRLAPCFTSAHMSPPDLWIERATIARREGMAAMTDSVVARWLTPGFAAAHPEVVERLRTIFEATDPEGYAGSAEAIAGMDQRADLGRIVAPTLVVAGAEDIAAPPEEHARPIAEAIPGARLAIIDGAPHLGSLERPDELTALLVGHLAGRA
jgi:3-oxoadipate enol-lactonase